MKKKIILTLVILIGLTTNSLAKKNTAYLNSTCSNGIKTTFTIGKGTIFSYFKSTRGGTSPKRYDCKGVCTFSRNLSKNSSHNIVYHQLKGTSKILKHSIRCK